MLKYSVFNGYSLIYSFNNSVIVLTEYFLIIENKFMRFTNIYEVIFTYKDSIFRLLMVIKKGQTVLFV